jgi:hypothetical protein
MFSAVLPALNIMRNIIDNADHFINRSYFIFIFIFQCVTNFRHSHWIVNEAFFCLFSMTYLLVN